MSDEQKVPATRISQPIDTGVEVAQGADPEEATLLAGKLLAGDEEGGEQDTPPGEPEDTPTEPDADNAVEEGGDASDNQETLIELPIPGDDGTPLKATAAQIQEWRKNGLLQADYTRKTQELKAHAEQIAAKDAELRTQVEQARQGYAEGLQRLQMAVLMTAAPELQNVDWVKLAEEDPIEYTRKRARYDQVTGMLANIDRERERVRAEAAQISQQELVENAKAAREELTQAIPTWSDAYYQSLIEYAVENGFPRDRVLANTDSKVFKVLHKAYQFDNAQKKTAEAKKVVAAKPMPPATVPGKVNNSEAQQKRAELLRRVKATGDKDAAVDAVAALLRR